VTNKATVKTKYELTIHILTTDGHDENDQNLSIDIVIDMACG
jgi:hypothetical protein